MDRYCELVVLEIDLHSYTKADEKINYDQEDNIKQNKDSRTHSDVAHVLADQSDDTSAEAGDD